MRVHPRIVSGIPFLPTEGGYQTDPRGPWPGWSVERWESEGHMRWTVSNARRGVCVAVGSLAAAAATIKVGR